MNDTHTRARKPFSARARTTRTVSRRRAAGGKANKKQKFVGSFRTDSQDLMLKKHRGKVLYTIPIRHQYDGGIVMTGQVETGGFISKLLDGVLNRDTSAPTPPPQVAIHTLADLEEKTMPALQLLAKNMGLRGYSKLKKGELVEFIYQSDENQE